MTQREKQIEEMARAISKDCEENCDMCDLNGGCTNLHWAKEFYDAGYRKAQPDAEEKHGKWKRVYNRPKSIIFRCSLCGGETYKYIQEYSYPYCPNCGAKMNLGDE